MYPVGTLVISTPLEGHALIPFVVCIRFQVVWIELEHLTYVACSLSPRIPNPNSYFIIFFFCQPIGETVDTVVRLSGNTNLMWSRAVTWYVFRTNNHKYAYLFLCCLGRRQMHMPEIRRRAQHNFIDKSKSDSTYSYRIRLILASFPFGFSNTCVMLTAAQYVLPLWQINGLVHRPSNAAHEKKKKKN